MKLPVALWCTYVRLWLIFGEARRKKVTLIVLQYLFHVWTRVLAISCVNSCVAISCVNFVCTVSCANPCQLEARPKRVSFLKNMSVQNLKKPNVGEGQKSQVIRKVKVWPPSYWLSLKVSSTLFRRAAPNFRPSNSFYIGITTKLELSTLPTDKKKTLAKFSKLGQTWYLGSSEGRDWICTSRLLWLYYPRSRCGMDKGIYRLVGSIVGRSPLLEILLCWGWRLVVVRLWICTAMLCLW